MYAAVAWYHAPMNGSEEADAREARAPPVHSAPRHEPTAPSAKLFTTRSSRLRANAQFQLANAVPRTSPSRCATNGVFVNSGGTLCSGVRKVEDPRLSADDPGRRLGGGTVASGRCG